MAADRLTSKFEMARGFLNRRWKLIAATTFCAFAVSAVGAFLQKPLYEAAALVRFQRDIERPSAPEQPEIFQGLAKRLAREGKPSLLDFQSWTDHFTSSRTGVPGVLQLRVRAAESRQAAELANLWAEELIQASRQRDVSRGEGDIRKLSAELETVQARLAELQGEATAEDSHKHQNESDRIVLEATNDFLVRIYQSALHERRKMAELESVLAEVKKQRDAFHKSAGLPRRDGGGPAHSTREEIRLRLETAREQVRIARLALRNSQNNILRLEAMTHNIMRRILARDTGLPKGGTPPAKESFNRGFLAREDVRRRLGEVQDFLRTAGQAKFSIQNKIAVLEKKLEKETKSFEALPPPPDLSDSNKSVITLLQSQPAFSTRETLAEVHRLFREFKFGAMNEENQTAVASAKLRDMEERGVHLRKERDEATRQVAADLKARLGVPEEVSRMALRFYVHNKPFFWSHYRDTGGNVEGRRQLFLGGASYGRELAEGFLKNIDKVEQIRNAEDRLAALRDSMESERARLLEFQLKLGRAEALLRWGTWNVGRSHQEIAMHEVRRQLTEARSELEQVERSAERLESQYRPLFEKDALLKFEDEKVAALVEREVLEKVLADREASYRAYYWDYAVSEAENELSQVKAQVESVGRDYQQKLDALTGLRQRQLYEQAQTRISQDELRYLMERRVAVEREIRARRGGKGSTENPGQILEAAQPPRSSYKQGWIVRLWSGTLSGFLIGLFASLILEYRFYRGSLDLTGDSAALSR